MKIIVVGGTGFLGRHLVWHAAAQGAEVIFTGRDAKAAHVVTKLAPAPVVWQFTEHGSPDAMSSLLHISRDADAIVHCAALSAPWGTVQQFHTANVISTAEVIHACQMNGIRRLVHISTPSIYFDFRDRLMITEHSPLPTPANEYARTKHMAEELVITADLPEVAILRPRALFGPWDQTLVPRLLRVMKNGYFPLMRGGQVELDLTYIDNAVDAAWLSLTHPLPQALNVWNVTNGEPRILLDLLTSMARAFDLEFKGLSVPWRFMDMLALAMETKARLGIGKEPLLTRYSAGVLAFSQTLDITALSQALPYHSRIGIDEGIQKHAAWWRSQKK